MTETFTETLRRRVSARIAESGISGRAAAKAIGVTHVALWHFLHGRDPSAAHIDRLVAWLGDATEMVPTSDAAAQRRLVEAARKYLAATNHVQRVNYFRAALIAALDVAEPSLLPAPYEWAPRQTWDTSEPWADGPQEPGGSR